MTSAAPSRPHARAVRQLLLGLVPVLVVGLVLLVVLAVRLPGTQAPLAAADATASATVVRDGLDPAGRGVRVSFTDAAGEERTGVLVLRTAVDVAPDAAVTVQYDPAAADGSRVYADGDAAHGAVGDVVFGLVLVALVGLAVSVLTGLRLLSRRRLAGRPTTAVTVTHLVVRRGLLVRSWLELVTPHGVRWVPVHWAPEVDRARPDSPALVHGDPATDALVLPVLDGQQVWPSGRVRRSAPRGDVRQAGVDPEAPDVGLARQARSDGVPVVLAPVLGLLWAYVDGSGAAGFVVAGALAAAVLFWLPQFLGSDPAATSR
ncbi:hypothetical protein [Modestobacter sp. Leaf380]|uniref:hypothetical protein n=1 Tax=Modestobacter sp. Leaf380 TaxID=1736356 RepID=UPI0006F6B230|nr:hypothetical protein [Modestobacter sp. Leaf380]KQS68433.1 hypothetical protein ASG41_05460 [Modestobacter sp. Leaf380]